MKFNPTKSYLLMDRAYQTTDIMQLKAICEWQGFGVSFPSIQKVAGWVGYNKDWMCEDSQNSLKIALARWDYELTDDQLEKLALLEGEYLMFTNAHLATKYGLTENQVEHLFKGAFGVKKCPSIHRWANEAKYKKVSFDKLTEEQCDEMSHSTLWRSKQRGYAIIKIQSN